MRVAAILVTALSLCAPSTFAEKVEPVLVPTAQGPRIEAAAPYLADRAGFPLLTLADARESLPEELEAIRAWNDAGKEPMKIGFTRSLGDTVRVRLSREPERAASGTVRTSAAAAPIWSGSLEVQGAYRLRLHLTNVVAPAGTTFWVYGSEARENAIPFGTELRDEDGGIYTPSVSGPVAYLEVQMPEQGIGDVSFEMSDVMEIVGPSGLRTASISERPVAGEDAPTCLVDATCVTSGTFDQIDLARRAVAHLEYIKNSGAYVCSGGLLNDKDPSTYIPYLLTAHHCLDSQTQTSTLEAFWDYDTATCGGAFPNIGSLQRSNGGQLLATSSLSDFTFIRLTSIPGGRGLLGWSAASLTAGTLLHRVSHPYPDTFANPAPHAYSTTYVNNVVGTCAGASRSNFLYSTAGVGGVYGGSSGSPVILSGGYVVGQLYGSCGVDPSSGCSGLNSTVDGLFSVTYPSIATYLEATGGGGGSCVPDATTACMLNSRFRVKVRYRGGFDNLPADTNAQVKPVTGFANPTYETAFFYFNNASNIEMMVKILDQGNQDPQGHPTIAVLFGSATPLRVELSITDVSKGTTKSYTSEFNQMKGATDFTAFVK